MPQSSITNYKAHYSKSLNALGDKLHFTAHSHHLWPDKAYEAHNQYCLDSAKLSDDKWEYIFSDILPQAQFHIAKFIGTTRASDIFFASNTHDIIIKIFSALKLGLDSSKPLKVLASDGEFHSFQRLAQAWSENNLIELTLIDSKDDHFESKFIEKMKSDHWDVVFTSHVFFETSYIVRSIEELIKELPSQTHLIIDGYHSLGAVPCELNILDTHLNSHRVFYMGGGYKYLQAGEGACFCLAPKEHTLKPYHTGWFANFGELQDQTPKSQLQYSKGGMAFAGATFDPSGLYRLNASAAIIRNEQSDITNIQKIIKKNQQYFLSKLDLHKGLLSEVHFKHAKEIDKIGSFISFQTDKASQISQRLKDLGISTDFRGSYLRFGFGVYQDLADIDELFIRIDKANR